jgi:hypothetical protein
MQASLAGLFFGRYKELWMLALAFEHRRAMFARAPLDRNMV